MRILFLNQAFAPDTVSSAQHAADLAGFLAKRGHDVRVIAGRRSYDDPSRRFPARERLDGVGITRIGSTGFGKKAKWRRAADFFTFLANCAARLAVSRRHDVTVAMTSPPLISFLAALFVRLRGGRLVLWVMDLNPDEAIAAGWLRPDAKAAWFLSALLGYSTRVADRIVVMDEFMRDRLRAKGAPPSKLAVLPPWTHDDAVKYDATGRAAFRAAHGLEGRFVAMYSGNHSPCHPLDTLLAVAERFRNDARFAFCFVGGGSEFAKVRRFAADRGLDNIVCLPYQPRHALAASLSAADLHTVVMGDPFVGIVHPCKIYNILALGTPFLYIGPEDSHIARMTPEVARGEWAYFARHGDADAVAAHLQAAWRRAAVSRDDAMRLAARFRSGVLLPSFVQLLEAEPAVSPAGLGEAAAGAS